VYAGLGILKDNSVLPHHVGPIRYSAPALYWGNRSKSGQINVRITAAIPTLDKDSANEI
jgi:hypothetical protein